MTKPYPHLARARTALRKRLLVLRKKASAEDAAS